MKAILVIDMPNECIECNQFVFECCHAMKRQIERENIVQCKRPSWCPLRPLPNKIIERGKWISEEYQKGWNAYREAVGETE